jgi:alpha-L-fucosidase
MDQEYFNMPNPRPTEKQLKFMDWELGVFFHFGIRTFYEGHKDWDNKPMPLEGFNPTGLDCGAWIKTVKAAGAKYAILVCKHHDGFANWPSKYTEYAVHNTPWKNGKGDVVREFTDACREHGVGVGLYYSPAQWDNKKTLTSEEYNGYFIAQLSELLVNYGKIDYLWLDGCGSENFTFEPDRIVAEIRRLQPDICLFHMFSPDTRWAGNEAGYAYVDNTAAVSGVISPDVDFGEKRFLPVECPCMMRDVNWFYSEYDVCAVKSVEELTGMYYHSVGNGANLLINIGPDRRGLLPETDSGRLIEFGDEIKRRFANPLPAEYIPSNDGCLIKLQGERLINHVVLREDLTDGEKIKSFDVYAKGGRIYNKVMIYSGKYVGHKRIVTFAPVRASEVVITVDAEAGFKLLPPEVFYIKS